MGPQSFTKLEHELIHHYREQLNLAESAADVKKAFARTTQELVLQATARKIVVPDDGFALIASGTDKYSVSASLKNNPDFKALWNQSDLPDIIERFAVNAEHRLRNLEKQTSGTRSRIGRH